MWPMFLKRVLGTTPEHEAAEKRYRKAQEELEKRDKELDALQAQIKQSSNDYKEQQAALSTTRTDLTATLSKTMSGSMEAVSDEEIEEYARGRTPPRGSPTPAGA